LSAQGATESAGQRHAHVYGALYLITWLAIHTALTRVKLRGATVWFHDETKFRLLTNIQHCMTHICWTLWGGRQHGSQYIGLHKGTKIAPNLSVIIKLYASIHHYTNIPFRKVRFWK
jgi:hypothetical protein